METSETAPLEVQLLETIQLEHLPPTHTVHIGVFRDISNAAFLHQQLLSRNADFEYAFIDASLVTCRLQVLSAVFKAIMIQLGGAMKTPNVHSEIVCSLSPNNNISEAYRRFGIAPTTKDLVVVKVLISPSSAEPSALSPQDVSSHLLSEVQGELAPFTDVTLSQLTDWAKVRKYYKLNGAPALDGIKDSALKDRETELLVLGAMALRGL
ncbi:CGI121 protein [Xylariaceae sp. FL0662B]|nr:CGI121 protein [Xylariaceae sp. FL0662B]